MLFLIESSMCVYSMHILKTNAGAKRFASNYREKGKLLISNGAVHPKRRAVWLPISRQSWTSSQNVHHKLTTFSKKTVAKSEKLSAQSDGSQHPVNLLQIFLVFFACVPLNNPNICIVSLVLQIPSTRSHCPTLNTSKGRWRLCQKIWSLSARFTEWAHLMVWKWIHSSL